MIGNRALSEGNCEIGFLRSMFQKNALMIIRQRNVEASFREPKVYRPLIEADKFYEANAFTVVKLPCWVAHCLKCPGGAGTPAL